MVIQPRRRSYYHERRNRLLFMKGQGEVNGLRNQAEKLSISRVDKSKHVQQGTVLHRMPELAECLKTTREGKTRFYLS